MQGPDDLADDFVVDHDLVALSDGEEGYEAILSDNGASENSMSPAPQKKRKRREKEKERKAKVALTTPFTSMDAEKKKKNRSGNSWKLANLSKSLSQTDLLVNSQITYHRCKQNPCRNCHH
jgi:hypothetical protein